MLDRDGDLEEIFKPLDGDELAELTKTAQQEAEEAEKKRKIENEEKARRKQIEKEEEERRMALTEHEKARVKEVVTALGRDIKEMLAEAVKINPLKGKKLRTECVRLYQIFRNSGRAQDPQPEPKVKSDLTSTLGGSEVKRGAVSVRTTETKLSKRPPKKKKRRIPRKPNGNLKLR